MAEGATAEEAELVWAENAKLRARIAELEGVRKHRGTQMAVSGRGDAEISKTGFAKNLDFSESCTQNCSDKGWMPNKAIADSGVQESDVIIEQQKQNVNFSETSTRNVHRAK